MSRIKSENTMPEKIVRSALHKAGYRFRLHVNNLPGKPDIVLPKYKTVIFVHGCFWHRHLNCIDAKLPKTHTLFWAEKLHKNVLRDQKNQSELEHMGWKVLIVWECEILKTDFLEKIKQDLL